MELRLKFVFLHCLCVRDSNHVRVLFCCFLWLQWCLQLQCLGWKWLPANQQSHLSSLYSASRRCSSLHCLLFLSLSSFSSRTCVLYRVLRGEGWRSTSFLECRLSAACHIFPPPLRFCGEGAEKWRKLWFGITVKYCSASSWSFSSFSWPPTSCFSLENSQKPVNGCCWPTTHRSEALCSE